MKKFFSLFLAMVLLISVLPTALAADCTGEHTWVADPENSKVATCIETGVDAQKCSVEGCTATKSAPIEALGHTVPENSWTETAAPTCTTEGKKTGTCTVCHTPVEDKIPATGVHSYENGVCKDCGADEPVASYTASAGDLSLTVGATGAVSITFMKDGAAASVTPSSVSYVSNNTAVATVSSSGVVTGVKKGVATITATVSGVNGISAVTCTVTVSDGAVISCSNIETSNSSAVIAPTLKVNGVTKNATFNFSVDGSSTSHSGSTMTLNKEDNGIVKVTVSVASFDGSDEQAGDVSDVDPVVVYVSFYETISSEATVRKGINSFMFDDFNIFTYVVIDKHVKNNPTNYSMMNLWDCSADWYNISLYQEDPESTVGSISYPGSLHNAFNPETTNDYSLLNIDGLKFNCLNKGEFKFNFSQYDVKTGLTVQSGTITINVESDGKGVTCSTTYNRAVSMKSADFNELWEAVAGEKEDPEYVIFEKSPEFGKLYVDDDMEKTVRAGSDKFYFSGKDKLLSDVTYKPEGVKRAHEVEIPFTIFGEDDTEVVGVLTIKIGETIAFTDVKSADYFYDAVVWAVNEGVTSGTSATTFSPNNTCTRAEVVTFLYRAAGAPDVTGTVPFTDVKTTDWYYDAVLWAYENDITTGLTSTTFGPKATVTRGQVVTFLWRAMGETSVSTSNPFTDVKATDYYYKAVLWAVKNDVTTGLTSTTFGPGSGCTRGQIVTFLYRAYED